jgi:Peptidase S24-like
MKFRTLQENLRKALRERIDEGVLTGLGLAKDTGFRQAHISNFLNRKRGLSVEGMDKVLNVQRLSVLDLLDPGEINKRASIAPPSQDDFDNVLLVDGPVAARQPIIMSMKVRDIMKLKRSFLRKLRPEMEGDRGHWERFVIIRVDAREGMSMYPRLLPGATVLLDRHYNSLKPYRKGESNMYAVARDGTCTVKYAEVAGTHLVLRPHNTAYPVEVMPMEPGKKVHDYLIGRVCYVGIET